MRVYRNVLIPPKDLISLKPLMKGRYEKRTRLSSETFKAPLRLNHENAKEVSNIKPLREMWFLLPNDRVEMCLGFGERV